MAYIHRVILGAAIALIGSSVFAAPEYKVEADNGTYWFETKMGACAGWFNNSGLFAPTASYTYGAPYISQFQGKDTCANQVFDAASGALVGVQESTSRWFDVRESTGGGDPGGVGQVEDFCNSAKGRAVKMTGTSGAATLTTACYIPSPPFEGANADKGCAVTLGDYVAVPNAAGGRDWSATGIPGGGTCTSAAAGDNGTNPTLTPRAAENPCPNGFPGSVNGTTVCVPSVPDSGIEGVKIKETKDSSGAKSVETEETKCNGGVCNTTKTVKTYDANGNLTNTVVGPTIQESIGTKCAADRGNKLCGAVGLGSQQGSTQGNAGSGSGGGGGGGGGEEGPSSFGGDCAAGYKAVSDDAVINAMAEETFRQNCKINPDEASQTLGKAEALKTGNLNGDNPNNSEKSIGPGDFDTSDAIGAGASCIADKTITVAGASVSLPFSSICQYLTALGYALLACSFLLAGRIVTRG